MYVPKIHLFLKPILTYVILCQLACKSEIYLYIRRNSKIVCSENLHYTIIFSWQFICSIEIGVFKPNLLEIGLHHLFFALLCNEKLP